MVEKKEMTEMMLCKNEGCQTLFRVSCTEFKFPNNDSRYTRCPKCLQVYKIIN